MVSNSCQFLGKYVIEQQMISVYNLTISRQHVKNQLERIPDQFTRLWKWRVTGEGKVSNGLGEGETGPREMSKVKMAAGVYLDSVL